MKLFKTYILAVTLLMATAGIGCSQTTTTTTTQTNSNSKTITIKVTGITCSMDLKMISASIEKVKGVSSCVAGKMGTTSTFDVTYDPTIVTEKEIHSVIENTGSCENPDERPYKVKQK